MNYFFPTCLTSEDGAINRLFRRTTGLMHIEKNIINSVSNLCLRCHLNIRERYPVDTGYMDLELKGIVKREI